MLTENHMSPVTVYVNIQTLIWIRNIPLDQTPCFKN